MPFFDPIRIGASGTVADYTVDRSLRFNKSESTDLQRTPSSTGNQKVWTWSAWFKRWALHDNGGTNYLFSCEPHSGNNGIAALYIQSDKIYTYFDTTGSNPYGAVNDRLYRDLNSWMHIVWQVDAANTSQRIWINGVEESLSSGNNPPNYSYGMNQSGQAMLIGSSGNWGAQTTNTYLAEIHYSDGNKYEASDFAETNTETGQWVPKEVNITYGTNGFYLNFSDNSGTSSTTLGKDSSGNGNNFTPNNFSVAAGTGNDSMKDTPTNNFATFNANFEIASSASYSEGNLEFSTSSTGQKLARSTFGHNSGKWYAEFKLVSYSSASGSYPYIGVAPANKADPYGDHNTWVGYIGTAVNTAGSAFKDGSVISGGFTYAAGDIIGMAMDVDNLLVYFYKNGTIQNSGSGYALTSDSDKGYQFAVSLYASSGTWAANFGGIGIGSYSDANGHGNFTYSVPSGYLAECSANLSDPTILLPNKHFAAFTYTGTGSSGDVVNITNSDVDFTPDWVWVKTRDVTNDHILSDSVRGGNKYLVSSEPYVEQTSTQKIRAFIQNGFESGTDGDTNWSGSRPFVAWNWNAGDTDGKTYTVKVVSDSGNKYRFDDFGTSAVTLDLAEGGTYIFDQSDSSNAGHPLRFSTTADGTHGGGSEYTTGVTTSGTPGSSGAYTQIVVAASAPNLAYYCSVHSGMGGSVNTNSTLGSSNFDGSVQSTVKVNASAGFSIIKYTSTNSDLTFGHGLGVKPAWVLVKNYQYSGGVNWVTWHQQLGDSSILRLNLDNTPFSNSNYIVPTATTIGGKGGTALSNSNNEVIVYCFSEVVGFSKFGKYEGNGSSDGTFVFTGFSPAWVMVKRTNDTDNWSIYDISRDTTNVMGSELFANVANAEQSNSSDIDFVSNGFKFRRNYTSNNGAGTFVYFAFAESPFRNARAR